MKAEFGPVKEPLLPQIPLAAYRVRGPVPAATSVRRLSGMAQGSPGFNLWPRRRRAVCTHSKMEGQSTLRPCLPNVRVVLDSDPCADIPRPNATAGLCTVRAALVLRN